MLCGADILDNVKSKKPEGGIVLSNSRIMKWITGGLEIFLAIPIVGGAVVIGLAYTPLVIMLALHIVTLVLSSKNGETKYGSIVGIVTSCIAWIPFVGWIMHVVSGILLMVSAAQNKRVAAPASTDNAPPPPNF